MIPNDQADETADEIHDRQVLAVMAAVARLTTPAAPLQCSPEAVFEGALKGGVAAIMASSDATTGDIADLLETVAESFRDLAGPNLHVVQ